MKNNISNTSKRNNTNHEKSRKYLAILIVPIITAIGVMYKFKTKSIKSESSYQTAENLLHHIRLLEDSPQTHEKALTLMQVPPENTLMAQRAMQFMRDLMKDKSFSLFFDHTLDFFGSSPAAYPAARFVGLTLLFDSSDENFYLRAWTQKEIKKYSKEIIEVIEKKADLIDVNPYFHSRILNLAFQLEIEPERKLNFFAKTLEKPIFLDSSGNLHDYSLAFETALILAKQSRIDSGKISEVISRTLAANSEDPRKIESLKVRVLTYYPDLNYLFTL